MVENAVERRLAAILAADVVGYSKFMGKDEAGTLAALRKMRSELVDPKIAEHKGRIFKTTGDGLLVEFPSVVNAVACAVNIQRELSARNTDLPEDRVVLLRIGVNLGDVIAEGDDIFGDGVNVAARLEAVSPKGGIAISGTVKDHLGNRLDLAFEDLGEQALKNIERPVRIFTFLPDVAVKKVPAPNAQVGIAKPSIAVLPFTNLSDDANRQYFCDGMTEDIITELSRWRLLNVQSRSASFRYRGIAADLNQIAKELKVRYIVEGSVRGGSDRIRITAQLIDTENGSHVWADRFDRETSDVFEVQDEVVHKIVSTLAGRVQAADAERVRRKAPASLAAYECVLKGNALQWSDPQGEREATQLFERAIEIDPGYGYANALLAVMRYRKWTNDLSGSDVALQEALRLAKRAVELDEGESTCLAVLAHVHQLRGSSSLALECMQRALQINPNNQWIAADMGSLQVYQGQASNALEWFDRAKQIDPYFNPTWCAGQQGLACILLRDYGRALLYFEGIRAPQFHVLAYIAGCHAQLGASDRAKTSASQCMTQKPDFTIARWVQKEPFKNASDAAHLTEYLRAAGLPE